MSTLIGIYGKRDKEIICFPFYYFLPSFKAKNSFAVSLQWSKTGPVLTRALLVPIKPVSVQSSLSLCCKISHTGSSLLSFPLFFSFPCFEVEAKQGYSKGQYIHGLSAISTMDLSPKEPNQFLVWCPFGIVSGTIHLTFCAIFKKFHKWTKSKATNNVVAKNHNMLRVVL